MFHSIVAHGDETTVVSFEIEIEKLVYGGQGLGRSNGRVVLAPFVLPGERAIVEAEKESAGLIAARTLAVEAGSEWRVPPACPHFAICGGCHYQHMSYERQLEAKRGILLETLARLGKIEWSEPVEILSAEPWGYRNRVQLRLSKRRGRLELGYFEFGSHRLRPIDACPISSPTINRTIAALARMGLDRRFPDFIQEIELFTNERDVQLNVLETTRPLARRFFDWCAGEIEGVCRGDSLDYAAGADVYRVSSRSFFQVNRFLAARLAEAAVGSAGGGTAIDLFAGVGLFSLSLGRRFSRTVAADSNRSACRDLECNAQRAGVAVEAHQASAESFLTGFDEAADFVLADPPRAGLGRAVTASLARLKPRRLTIVSCDPATLARDLRALLEATFQIISVKLVDLFPQTYHIESVVELAAP
ncbi:MAG TPA: class I SAM-dependent RNA methyltransferase [Bryobacterales bacterium]|nr:class I SAM-dependent RNA methyltransferase [Bryobacterales bacterium]